LAHVPARISPSQSLGQPDETADNIGQIAFQMAVICGNIPPL